MISSLPTQFITEKPPTATAKMSESSSSRLRKSIACGWGLSLIRTLPRTYCPAPPLEPPFDDQ